MSFSRCSDKEKSGTDIMKAFIYTGGVISPENITERPKDGDTVIAADSGYINAKTLGIAPDLLLGDFDSLGEENLPEGVEIIRVPAEKDFTDTQLATETALKKGASEIVIVGGLDGRLDHTLSNLAILEHLASKKVRAHMTNGISRIMLLDSSSVIIPKGGFKYLSVIAISDKLKGVSIEGCKYPLENATIEKNFQYAVSNEIEKNCALISIRKGRAYIIESNDPS